MNFLRSSPFLSFASALQDFILTCCGVSFFAVRHVFMNALRSSPFLSPASLLHVAILVCCLVSAAWAAPNAKLRPTVAAKRMFFMVDRPELLRRYCSTASKGLQACASCLHSRIKRSPTPGPAPRRPRVHWVPACPGGRQAPRSQSARRARRAATAAADRNI